MTKNDFCSLDALLAGVSRLGIAGHVRPDGDCLGSTLAVYNYIKDYYPKTEVCLFLEEVPPEFTFLRRAEEVITDYPQEPPFDLFVAIDSSDPERLGRALPYFEAAGRTACIDHHISNQGFADLSYLFPESSSASELVFELIPRERITKEIAECLYTGIIHDTGVFQYSCTSAKTMAAGGFLMERGIDYPGIVDRTFYTRSFTQQKLLGLALGKSTLELGGRVIVSYLTAADMESCGATRSDTGAIVSQLRLTKDTDVALFLYETSDPVRGQGWKGSLRVNSEVNVARVAEAFGGGGHIKAAGFTYYGSLEHCLTDVLKEIGKQLETW